MTTATDVVLACENRLGWSPPLHQSLHIARRVEAGKINKKLAATPGVTFEDLLLAVEMLHRRREAVTTPTSLFWKLDEVRELSNAPLVHTDLALEVQQALDIELYLPVGSEGREDWIGRLTRARGDARRDTLAAWREAGRG